MKIEEDGSDVIVPKQRLSLQIGAF